MTTLNLQPLVEKAMEDEEFGSRLIAFAKAHGVDMLGTEELSEDQLDEVAGGIMGDLTARRITLRYTPKLLPGDQFLPGDHFLPGDQFSR